MIHLSINTAIEPYGIGAFEDEKFLGGFSWNFSESKKNLHFVFLESLLNDLKISREDFKFITIVGGPGSFTGLRIGFTMAKTIGFIMKTPLVVPSTFEVLKYVAKIDGLFVINAGLGEVFVSDGDKVEIMKFEDLKRVERILIFPERSLFIKAKKDINLNISISEVGKIGFYKYNKGEIVDYENALPYYMRDTKEIFKPYKEE